MSDPVSRETREWSEISSEGISGANQCPVVFILQTTYCPLPWGGDGHGRFHAEPRGFVALTLFHVKHGEAGPFQ